MRDLDRLLNPRTIAVIGGEPAARAIEQSDRLGFTGEVWPVHPTKREIGGRIAYSSLDDLPGVPDAAFVAVNRKLTIEAVHQLAAMGAGGAVLYASGFAEVGPEGAALQEELTAGHDLPLIGPNCYGTINARSGAALWPDVHGCTRVERGPAFIGQSGNITLNMTMNRRGVDLAYALSLGNQASVTVEECIAHFAYDPVVTAIGIYLESIHDSVAFGTAALMAKDTRTPIVVLRTGRSETAERIAVTHTAAISAPADAYDALFDRYGIVGAESLPEMMTTLSMLDTIGPLPGNRLISLSCSGGEASIVADRSAHHDVTFQPLTDDHRRRIRATLSEFVAMTNPLDYHTFIWGDGAALERCFTEVLDGPVDAGMLVLDWPDETNDDGDWWPTLEAIESASATTGTSAIVVTSLPENLPARVREHLNARGLGTASTIDEALAGLAACAQVGRWFDAPTPPIHREPGHVPDHTETLGEVESKDWLRSVGVSVPRGTVIQEDELPYDLSFPLVAKVVGSEHKTEIGGVVMGISDEASLSEAVRRLQHQSSGLLIEEMVTGAVAELLVSVRREPSIGVVATIGSGGTAVELLDDTATLLLPATRDDIAQALRSTRIGRLLEGFRGANSGDIESVVRTIEIVGAAIADRADIVEIEINPLMVTTDGAWAVDALIIKDHP